MDDDATCAALIASMLAVPRATGGMSQVPINAQIGQMKYHFTFPVIRLIRHWLKVATTFGTEYEDRVRILSAH